MPEVDEAAEGVIRRRMVFCPFLLQFDTHDLIRSCEGCHDFFLYCCGCNNAFEDDGYGPDGKLCHHFRLVFTDGACRQNGQQGATSGIGIAGSKAEELHLSLPITTDMDPNQKRTSQRAELLAALEGLQYFANNSKRRKVVKGIKSNSPDQEQSWIIATDSLYVVEGMTEWLPVWKVCQPSAYIGAFSFTRLILIIFVGKENNFRTSQNKKPANLDLFLKLDEELTAEENKQNVKIGFWHVAREYNKIADGLAKKAALQGDL